MTPNLPQSTRILLDDDGNGHTFDVDAEAFATFSKSLEKSLLQLETQWAGWAPPVSQKAERRGQFGR